MATESKSPKPTADDVLRGWHIVTDGSVQPGDRFWSYRTRSWLPAVSRESFLGSKIGNLLTVIIRSNGGDKC